MLLKLVFLVNQITFFISLFEPNYFWYWKRYLNIDKTKFHDKTNDDAVLYQITYHMLLSKLSALEKSAEGLP